MQAQPGIDPGKTIVYQLAAWWLGVICLWFLVALLIIAPLTQSLGAVSSWAEINWNLKWLTLVLGLAGAVPFYAMRTRGRVSTRRYVVYSVNIQSGTERSPGGEKQTSSRTAEIRPYRILPPMFLAWWFRVPYDIGDGILEFPMTVTGRHAPGVEPVPPTELPPEMQPESPYDDGASAPRPEDPPDSPYNDRNQGFSENRF